MTEEQENQIIDSLVAFITRVANNESATEAELAILPETVHSLVEVLTTTY